MKLFSFFFFLVFASFVFAQPTKHLLKKYPKDVQKIILTESGIFRGFNFNETKEVVKSKEKLQLHSESDSSLLYTLYLNADDSADLIYYFDKSGKTKSFAIVFILSNSEEEQLLRNNLTKFYNEKFGAFSIINTEDELWDTKQDYLVEMRDTSDESGMEIEVVYYKTSN